MTSTHRLPPAALLAALTALVGCGAQAGGQTGEESDGRCVFATSELSADELSPLGFSAAHVRAYVDGQHAATFDWRQDPNLSYGPETGSAEATVQVSPAGPAKLGRVVAGRSAETCEDQVRIPVSVGLSTAGGALDESFSSHLVATKADEAVIIQSLPASSVHGRFAFDPGVLGERRFIRLELNLGFTPEDFSGYLVAGIESGGAASTDGTASFQALPLACWGEVPGLHSACPN